MCVCVLVFPVVQVGKADRWVREKRARVSPLKSHPSIQVRLDITANEPVRQPANAPDNDREIKELLADGGVYQFKQTVRRV